MFPRFRCDNRRVYREIAPPPDLAAHVACVWTSVSRGGAIFPDGCVDIVWRGDRLVVAGPATGPVRPPLPVGAPVFGVRFRLGVAGAALGLPADELADDDGPAGRRVGAVGARSGWPPAGRRRCVEAVRERVLGVAARSARAGRGAADGASRARASRRWPGLGVSERQLRRRFADAVGYGPKTLARVLRFQRFLELASRRRRGPGRGWRSRRATPTRRT